jgi:hypothetical protein
MHFFRTHNYKLKNGQLTEKELGGALAADMLAISPPVWVTNGVGRFLTEKGGKIKREDALQGFVDRLGLDGGVNCLKGFFCRDEGSLADDTLLAQQMDLVSRSFQPKNYSDLKKKVLDTWATPERRQTIKNGIERYWAALAYWQKYGLDAAVKGAP